MACSISSMRSTTVMLSLILKGFAWKKHPTASSNKSKLKPPLAFSKLWKLKWFVKFPFGPQSVCGHNDATKLQTLTPWNQTQNPPRSLAKQVVIAVAAVTRDGPIIEGSLEVKLPTIWTDEKQRWEESEKGRVEERRSEKRKSQKKEDAGARKGRKVVKHCVFPKIRGSGGSKN